MKRIVIAIASVGAVFAAVPLQAQEAAEPEAKVEQAALSEQAEAAQRDDDAIVCRNLAPEVGTRIPGRQVCLPIYQWEEWDRTTRETARDVEMRGRLRGR